MWKIKYRLLMLLAIATGSDRMWEKAWAYGYRNTFARNPSKKELESLRSQLKG